MAGLGESRRQFGAFLLVFCAATAACAQLYSEDGPIPLLNEETFQKNVMESSGEVWMLEYFKDDCPSCVEVKPIILQAAQLLKGTVKVGVVDCKAAMKVCDQAQIKRLPSIQVFSWDKKKNPYTGKYYKDSPLNYEGPTNARQIADFAQASLPSEFVDIIASANGSSEAFLSAQSTPVPPVILITEKKTVPPLLKAVSLQFRGRLRFAQASFSDDKLAAKLQATSFPSLFVRKGGETFEKYEGALKAEPIAEFLEGFALKEAVPEEGEGEGAAGSRTQKQQGGAGSDKDPGPAAGPVDLGIKGEDFEKVVLEAEDAFLVAFVNKVEECNERVDAWTAALSSVQGMVMMADLDVSKDTEAANVAKKYGVERQVQDTSKCVAALLFEFGDEKADSEPTLYTGALQGKELSAFVLGSLPDIFVHQVTKASFVAFNSMDPRKPKVLLFSAKTEVPGVFRALSTRFRKEVAFGMIHEREAELMEQFKIQKVPDVRAVFGVPSTTKPGQLDLQIHGFQGALKFRNLAMYVMQLIQVTGGGGGRAGSADLPQIENDEHLQQFCVEKKRLCVIGVFKSQTATFQDHKEALTQVATQMGESGAFAFSWVDVGASPAFAAALDVPLAAAPTVVVISPQKMRSAVMEDTVSAQAVTSFLNQLLSGGVHTIPISKLPSFEGAQAVEVEEEPKVEEPIEEEFNLDDIMSEEIEDAGALASKEKRLAEVEKELQEAAAAKKAEEEAAAAQAKKDKNKKKKKKKKSSSKEVKDEL